jgi:homoserine acetyltransferase
LHAKNWYNRLVLLAVRSKTQAYVVVQTLPREVITENGNTVSEYMFEVTHAGLSQQYMSNHLILIAALNAKRKKTREQETRD